MSKRFRIGDRVRVRPDSGYYVFQNYPDGRITSPIVATNGPYFGCRVTWPVTANNEGIWWFLPENLEPDIPEYE